MLKKVKKICLGGNYA